MSGHSYGGATALLVGNSEPRIKAVLTHDPWLLPIGPDLEYENFKNVSSKEMNGDKKNKKFASKKDSLSGLLQGKFV